MRMKRQPWGLALLIAAGLIGIAGTVRAESAPVVRLNSEVKDGVVRLVAQAAGPFEYTTSRPNRSLFVLDLTGVSAPVPTVARTVDSSLVSGYRVLSYGGAKPIVRVEVRMSANAEPKVERVGTSELTLTVAGAITHGTSAEAGNAAAATDTKSSSTSTPGIEHVQLEQAGGDTEVNVTGNVPLTYHVSRLAHPDRIVLDFSGAQIKTSERSIASNLDPVRAIRLAQFSPEVARVVIELRGTAPYTVNAKGNIVTVEFVGGSATKGSAKGNDDANSSTVNTTQNAGPVSSHSPANGQIAAVTSPAVVLPANLTQPGAALASANDNKTKLATPAPAGGSNTTRAASDAQQAATPPASGRFSGEPISVNLKDVDLRDFFRLIHEISGLNIVVDPNVKGNLTIVLDDVPWDQALDIVLHNNDLEKQLDGNVLRIATRETIKKEAQESRELAQAQAEAADIVTTTRVLSYAKADEMIVTLKKFSSSRGDVIGDTRSNTVIIRDIPAVLPVMDNLIRQLDRKSQQVEIEARVVAANRNFDRDIGAQWAFSAGTASRNNIFGGDTGVGTSQIVRNPPLPTPPLVVSGGSSTSGAQMPLSVGLGATVPTSGISYAFSSRNFALDLIIDASEQKGVGKLISKPRLITQNNQKAEVKQGTKIPVQTIVNNTISVQFVDAVLKLDVTPQITAEGTIFMDVQVTNDQIDQAIPRVEGIPDIDTQEEDTRVTIADGGTVVIGGIIVSNQQTAVAQVPVFGSLPVIGNLFRHTTVSSTSQELLFFLTPRILPN